jgi:metal-responsive CopG/Arc/MetJ family transcriptional regulator
MKITIDASLYDRVQQAVKTAGYSSADEFVTHAIENELQRLKLEKAEQQVANQLRGLGYVE